MAELSVIIPTRNREPILRETLHYLDSAVRGTKVEVIVVNDSEHELAIPTLVNPVTILRNPGRGVASARNTGAQYAKADLLLFLDDDMWLYPDAIAAVLNFHKFNSDAALNLDWVYPEVLRSALARRAFGRFLETFGFTSLKGWSRGLPWQEESTFPSSGITSQNLSIPKSLFFRVGGYDSSFPFAGFEDHAFSQKLKDQGIQTYVDTRVRMHHNEIDRIQLRPWLERKIRGGYTRKVAVEQGYEELKLNYGPFKSLAFKIIGSLKPLLISIVESSGANRFTFIDPLTFRLIGWLLAHAIYQGYTSTVKEINPM